MDKEQFLTALRNALAGLPEADIQRSLDYYSEMIDDRCEDGMSEQEAVRAAGSPEEIAQEILLDMPMGKLVQAKMRPKRGMRAWEIVLLIVGSPIWLSLLLSLGAVVLSVYIVLWSVILSFYAVTLSLAICAVAGILGCMLFFFSGRASLGLMALGAGLVCGGLAIVLFLGSGQVAKGLLLLSRKCWRGLKSLFIRKES